MAAALSSYLPLLGRQSRQLSDERRCRKGRLDSRNRESCAAIGPRWLARMMPSEAL
jgi:hypothetical protein